MHRFSSWRRIFSYCTPASGSFRRRNSSPPRRVRSSPPFLREKPSASAARISSAGASGDAAVSRCGSPRRVGRRSERFPLRRVFRAVSRDPLCHGGLRHSLFRLGAAVPFELLSSFLPRDQGHRRPAAVRVQQKSASYALSALHPPLRRPRVGLHAFLRGNFTSKLNRTRRCTR